LGTLILKASYGGGPSPVLYIPIGIRDVLNDRTLELWAADRSDTTVPLKISGANAWGFGQLLATCGIRRGDQFEIEIDLLAGSASLRGVTETSEVTNERR
jgi:hypothetical protein